MNRFSLFTFGAALSVCLGVGAASAEDFQPAQAKITASVLNARNIASSGGTVIGTVRRGDLVQVIERSKAQSSVDDITEFWYRIQLPKNQTGWVFGGYITFEVNLESGLRWKTVRPANEAIVAVAAMPKGEIIVGTKRGELFATTDKGKSFRKIVPQALGSSLRSAWYMVEHGGALFIAAGEKGGLWVTKDNGASWAQSTAAQGLPSDDVYDIKFDDGKIWVAAKGGIAFSEDQGLSWKRFGPAEFPGGVAFSVLRHKGRVLVGAEKGLYTIEEKSGIFGGKSEAWTKIGDQSRLDSGVRALVASGPRLLAGTSRGLAVSASGDPAKWVAVGGDAPIATVRSDAKNRILVGTMSGGLNISLDGGATWVTYKREHGLGGDKVSAITVNPTDGTIWAASEGGLSFHE